MSNFDEYTANLVGASHLRSIATEARRKAKESVKEEDALAASIASRAAQLLLDEIITEALIRAKTGGYDLDLDLTNPLNNWERSKEYTPEGPPTSLAMKVRSAILKNLHRSLRGLGFRVQRPGDPTIIIYWGPKRANEDPNSRNRRGLK